jgi:hypothetical protein
LAILVLQASAQAPAQVSFATPQDAATALLQGLRTNDLDRLQAIFGPGGKDFSSGDPVLDRHDREVVALAMEQSFRWVDLDANRTELVIGNEAWPFPVPLARTETGWRFDTEAGKTEVLARRIGRNELAVIGLCQTYVLVQQQYSGQGHDGKKAGLYAQKVRSTPGLQDGLYWSVKPGEPPSPLGDLAAAAAAEGYDREKEPSAPFVGYYFRILTAQGRSASGGAKDYVVDGDMSGGFALVAYPAKYGFSGVMTFIVNQNGVVYQKDLGKETATLAGDLKVYNPDKTWTKVRLPKAKQ